MGKRPSFPFFLCLFVQARCHLSESHNVGRRGGSDLPQHTSWAAELTSSAPWCGVTPTPSAHTHTPLSRTLPGRPSPDTDLSVLNVVPSLVIHSSACSAPGRLTPVDSITWAL